MTVYVECVVRFNVHKTYSPLNSAKLTVQVRSLYPIWHPELLSRKSIPLKSREWALVKKEASFK